MWTWLDSSAGRIRPASHQLIITQMQGEAGKILIHNVFIFLGGGGWGRVGGGTCARGRFYQPINGGWINIIIIFVRDQTTAYTPGFLPDTTQTHWSRFVKKKKKKKGTQTRTDDDSLWCHSGPNIENTITWHAFHILFIYIRLIMD